MISIQSYVRKGHHILRRWVLDPRAHLAIKGAAYILAGLLLSAASLAGKSLPLAMGFVCGCSGWCAVLAALGSAAGYLLFWGTDYQLLVWVAAGLTTSLVMGIKKFRNQNKLLLPVLAGLIVALSGLFFRTTAQDMTSFLIFLIRVGLAFAGTWLAVLVTRVRNPLLDWLACGVGVFALAQIVPIPYLSLGYLAAGALTAGASFPAAALAGLALDLAQVTPIPMTAVVTLSYLVRFLPRYPNWLGQLAPAAVYIAIMRLVGVLDLQPLPGLLLGGFFGTYLPPQAKVQHRRGEAGVAQVRLEVAAGVLNQTRQLLLEVTPVPVDEDALVHRAADRACSSCPYRKACKDARRISQLPGSVLHKNLRYAQELPIVCRKSGRFLTELHRSQEQLGAIQADRRRQEEYREALMQQYQFLSEFLQDLSDQLTHRTPQPDPVYAPRVAVYGNRPEADNGDQCVRFSGTGGKHFVLLCDGMGTGLGAIAESRQAGTLLRRMLSAGFPAAHALRSLNSLCALRERAAAVTVDLAEIDLDTGKTVLYKWGAPPSYLVSRGGAERIGAVVPPPGLWVAQERESVHRVTLRRNQILVLVSDGMEETDVLRCCTDAVGETPSELAARLLNCVRTDRQDDATIVLVDLTSESE